MEEAVRLVTGAKKTKSPFPVTFPIIAVPQPTKNPAISETVTQFEIWRSVSFRENSAKAVGGNKDSWDP